MVRYILVKGLSKDGIQSLTGLEIDLGININIGTGIGPGLSKRRYIDPIGPI